MRWHLDGFGLECRSRCEGVSGTKINPRFDPANAESMSEGKYGTGCVVGVLGEELGVLGEACAV